MGYEYLNVFHYLDCLNARQCFWRLIDLNVSTQSIKLFALALLSSSVFAQSGNYELGVHYTQLSDPIDSASGDRIRVTEAFWYGCPHCFDFAPLLHDWESERQEIVELEYFPAQWSDVTERHAQLYYTTEALLTNAKIDQATFDQLQDAIYDAIHLENNALLNGSQIGAFFTDQGINQTDAASAFNSEAVASRLANGFGLTQRYELAQTPSMIVNGKYLVSRGPSVPTHEEVLKVVDFLVALEREWPAPFNGVAPDQSLNLDLNNISALNPADGMIYSCVNVLFDGVVGTYNGSAQYDIGFEIVSEAEGLIGVVRVRPFNEANALTADGELPDCSGSVDLVTGVYSDFIQAGADVFDVEFNLVDDQNLVFSLATLETVEGVAED